MRNKWLLASLMAALSLCSCYHRVQETGSEALVQYSERQLDSLSFQSSHHYTNNYNFLVKGDTLFLLHQQPEEKISGMPTDSFPVTKGTRLVVADIRMIPQDSQDSVWIQLATEQSAFGWIHEQEMLKRVVPDDPISQFIAVFSDTHVLIFLVVICVIAFGYWMRILLRHNARIVHFRDIDSFYPALLAFIVAASATFYASIQMFAPDVWRHFYYHPTLNPFAVPPLLSIFLSSVWMMLIVAIATIDDVRNYLSFGDAVLYLSGLVAVCAFNYILFSVSTLYYIGYVLLVAYACFALHRYLRRNSS